MFRRLGVLAARAPFAVIAAWLAVLIAVTALGPKLSDVVNSSQAGYLPKSYNSQKAAAILQQAFPDSYSRSSAVIVTAGPAAARRQAVADYSRFAATKLAPRPLSVVSDSLTPQLASTLDSKDGRATLISVGWQQLDSSSLPAQSLKHLRAYIASHPYHGVSTQVTGDVAINADYQTQVDKSSQITTFATVALVLLILLAVFRSLALLIVPLGTIGVALTIANGVVAFLGKHWLTVSSETPIFLIVLLAGAGTDYCLFLASRYKEELLAGRDPEDAVIETMTHVGEAIASSGAAVIVGMGAMAFASFGLFNTTGPAVAVGVAITLLAALTLTPSILRLLGRRAFWPARLDASRPSAFWQRVGQTVSARPLAALAVVLVLMVPLNLGLLRVGQDFNFLSDLGRNVEAHSGFNAVEQHYGAGNALPSGLVIQAQGNLRTGPLLAKLDRLDASIAARPGISGVQGPTRPAGAPLPYAAFATNKAVAAALDQNLSRDGRVAHFTITTSYDPYGSQAKSLVKTIRADAQAAFPGANVYTDGATAQIIDLQDVISSDFGRILLFVLGGILVVLTLLVRALVAPVYLLVTVVLSLGTTVGATTIVFQGLGGQSGLVFWVPFLILTMLIGLATDYNILLISRVREELGRSSSYRAAVAHAVERTGGIITTCGLVLAGSFGTLMLASVTGLRELGFAVAFGVLFDAVILRTMAVPALVVLIGDWSWFPRGITAAVAPAGSESGEAKVEAA